MKQILLFTLIVLSGFIVASCGSETCQTCTITQTTTQNGVEVGVQTINSNQEYCGDALDEIKASETTITQTVAGITQEISSTVDCQ